MPKTAFPDSPRLGIVRYGKIDPEKTINCFGVSYIIQKLLLLDDDVTVVNGTQWIVDFEGVTMVHILQVTPTIMRKVFTQSQAAAPLRVKGLHFVNAPAAVDTIMNFVKSMLNEKNRNRMFVHSNLDSVYQHIPKSQLPVEYGGNGGTIREITDAWKAKRKQYSSWLEEDIKYKTDESKRPGKPKTAESFFGIEGSFRQLEFD